MRLLIISKIFYQHVQHPDHCAQGLQSFKVANALAEQGIDVHVIAGIDSRNPVATSFVNPTIEIHYVPYCSTRRHHAISVCVRRFWRGGAYFAGLPTNWVKAAVAKARELITQYTPDAIMTISNPFDSTAVGLLLRRSYQIPWIASFNDPWPNSMCPAPYCYPNRFFLLNWKDYRLLRRILFYCDGIHMTSKYTLELTARHTSDGIIKKASVIPHIGSSTLVRPIPMDRYLLHIGNIGSERIIPTLPSSIKSATQQLGRSFLGLICVGRVSQEFTQLVNQAGANKCIIFRPFVNQETASALAAGASALLVIEANMQYSPFLPSKFADYATTNRPIIAITPKQSAIRDYLAQFGGGIAVGYEHDEIVGAIRSTFTNCAVPFTDTNEQNSLRTIFSPEKVGAAYLGLIEKAISRVGAL